MSRPDSEEKIAFEIIHGKEHEPPQGDRPEIIITI